MKTRISVIIPVYNVQEFLEECIDSVLEQTINKWDLTDGYERNLQIILIDDGSTDDSGTIAKDYAAKYENVEYIYEENQGLGHARNYGCEFAEGDYLIFLDSDDKVPPKAYERMYRLALKNDSDMTIGSVWNFNSKLTWFSIIHDICFSGRKECTHIKESPELFYDTTAWNKLVKRSFWDKHHFKFPEGILYEDIPVTMPMHYLANNVSIVYDNCYLWRVREGISKSITQTTDDLKNLQDRLFVMSLVDDFFDENVSEPELKKIKDIKWVTNDLMIFINKIKSIPKEDVNEIMEILINFINENIPKEALKYLNEIDALKYEYLLNNDYENLISLLNFEHEKLASSKVYKKDSHIMMDVDKDVFKTSSFCVDKFIKEGRIRKYIQDVSMKKKHIEIKGFIVVPGLAVENFEDREYSFYLLNSDTHKKIPLRHDDVLTGDLSSFNLPYGNDVPYDTAGYKVYIPYSEIRDNEDFFGENKILVEFKQNGAWTRNLFLGSAKKDVRKRSNLRAVISGDSYFCIKYELNNEVVIDISPVNYRYDTICVEDDKLCISSPEYDGEISLYYEKDYLNDENTVSFSYNEEKQQYEVDIDKLPNSIGKIIHDDGRMVVSKSKKIRPLYSDAAQFIVNTLFDYQYKIQKLSNISVISDISKDNNKVNFNVALHSTEAKGKKLNAATLYFKVKRNEKICEITEGNILNGNEINFSFDINDKIITENTFQSFFDLMIEYDFGDLVFSTPIQIFKPFKYIYPEKTHKYMVYRSGKSTLRLQSKRIWSFMEDTEEKRQQNSTFYRLCRLLPIKKNYIMFESMWGGKYTCNPRFLYEYIDNNHPEFKCVWSLNDENIPINGNGLTVRRNSLKYFYYLARSKFFVNNVNFHDHYLKRDNQIEIQTMHGTPLKTLGLDVPGDFDTIQQKKKFIKKCERWDYLTVQSEFVSDITRSCFRFKKEFLEYGYPRTDILYTMNNEEDILKLKKKLHLPTDKKIILYAPTWRKKSKLDIMLDLKSFKESFSDDYILILRLHHFSSTDGEFDDDEFIYDLSKYDSAEHLYLVSDILITDYSSVMFDYSILNRPILLFTYDFDEYKHKLRGFYIDIEKNKPGPLLYTSEEVEDAIRNIDKIEEEYKPYLEKFREKFNQYECEDSSEKIFNEVFLNSSKKKK